METTYKPTYEQLEKAVDHALDALAAASRNMKNEDFNAAALRDVQRIKDMIAPPPPTYEEVTVERWECDKCRDVSSTAPNGLKCGIVAGFGVACNSTSFTKLTGTRRVPVKQPVRKSAVISFDNFGCYHVLSGGTNVNGTKGTYNWEE